MFNKGYFKGWYYKCCTEDQTIAFIPAFHRVRGRKTASLQIITDHEVFHIPFDSLQFQEKPLFAKLGDCIFSLSGIKLDLKRDGICADGALHFADPIPIRYDIMGPFSLVPFMECRHSVYSLRHQINGRITVNGQPFHFKNGAGYIEGDRGSSFPKRYLWAHCFFQDISLMLSVADIPLGGRSFTGILGIILLNGREYRIATYLGARIRSIEENAVTIVQGGWELTARLIEKNALPLRAPQMGNMDRTIHENAACTAFFHLSYKNQVLCQFISDRASFEFEYA